MKRTLVFIGSDFYWKSKTSMSFIYEVTKDAYRRFDWGFLEIALGKGDTFTIRQATPSEKRMFTKQLTHILRDNKLEIK